MVNSSSDEVTYLEPWMELVGSLRELSHDDKFTYIKIGDAVLSFINGSQEAELLTQKLHKCVGERVGILKTDLSDNPLLLRLIKKY